MAKIVKKVENLKPGKQYVLGVKVKNTSLGISSETSDLIRFQVPLDPTIPAEITNLQLYASFEKVMFKFDFGQDEDISTYDYELYDNSSGTGTATASGRNAANIFTVAVPNSTDTEMKSYWGRVRGIDTTGNEGPWTSLVQTDQDTPLIDEQYIDSLTASKITAGTIGAHEIVLTQPGTPSSYTPPANMAVIRTSNYQSGLTGWLIRGDGQAEFNNITVRGTVEATAGTFKGALDIGGPDDDSLQVDTSGNFWIGNRVFESAKFRVTNTGNFTTTGTGNISGTLSVTGNTTIGSGTSAGGSPYSELLRVNGTTVLAGTTYVTGATTVSGNLTVNGSLTTVSGNLTVNGTVINIGGPSSTTTVSGTLIVGSATTISGGLTVNGTTTLNANLTFGSGAPIVQVNNGKIRGNNGTVYWEVDSSGFRAGLSEGASNIVSVGQTLRVLGGSASSPAIGFSGDDDTGFFQVANNQFGVSAGQQLVAYFTSDPYVIVSTPNTTNSTTVRVHSFGFGYTTLGYPSSKREYKNNINEISNSLSIIDKLKPSTFKWNRMPDDDDFKAGLRPFVTNYGFIAEEVAEVDSQLAVWEPYSWDGMTEEDKITQMNDLGSWIPSYWSESAMIALCVAAIKDISNKLKNNNIL